MPETKPSWAYHLQLNKVNFMIILIAVLVMLLTLSDYSMADEDLDALREQERKSTKMANKWKEKMKNILTNINSDVLVNSNKIKLNKKKLKLDRKECMDDDDKKGVKYAGRIDVTEMGYRCRAWLQVHAYKKDSYYPEKNRYRAKNYCRNPKKSYRVPWCYLEGKSHSWGACDIPKCSMIEKLKKKQSECLPKNDPTGKNYLGKLAGKGSIKCQAWNSNKPNKHHYRSHMFKEKSLSLVKNYCRNPQGASKKPWCYTMQKSPRFIYCNIPTCESLKLKKKIAKLKKKTKKLKKKVSKNKASKSKKTNKEKKKVTDNTEKDNLNKSLTNTQKYDAIKKLNYVMKVLNSPVNYNQMSQNQMSTQIIANGNGVFTGHVVDNPDKQYYEQLNKLATAGIQNQFIQYAMKIENEFYN